MKKWNAISRTVLPACLLALCCVLLFFCYCSDDSDESGGTGSIYGVVTDKATGNLVPAAGVQLRPSGRTTVTGSDGRYEFKDLDVGTYSLNVTKSGYTELIDPYEIKVSASSSIQRDVQIERLPSNLKLTAGTGTGAGTTEISDLDFSSGGDQRNFNVVNGSYSSLEWEIINNCGGVSVNPKSGALVASGSVGITVTIERDVFKTANNGDICVISVTSPTSGGGAKELILKLSPYNEVTILGGGEGASGKGWYPPNHQVNIFAGTISGKLFTNWTVTSGGATLARADKDRTTFTMPANAVTVTANFRTVDTTVNYKVTVTGGGAGSSGSGNYSPGKTITISAGAPPAPDQEFKNWTTTSNGVSLADTENPSTTFTMPANDVTITANFQKIAVVKEKFTDTRDRKEYSTVKISSTTWMAENLNYETADSWCYDNKSENCAKYGRLYTWNSALQACPSGWRLADTTDWKNLVSFAGGTSTVATKLKAKSPDWNGTDDYGFSAKPGGLAGPNGNAVYFIRTGSLGEEGYWWQKANTASYRSITSNSSSMDRGQGGMSTTVYCSVRCVKN